MEFETKFSQAHHCKKELCFSLLYMCIVMKAEVIHFIIQKNQAFSIIVNKTFLKYRTSLWYRNDCLATTTTTIVIIIIINNQSDVWVQNNYKISCIKEMESVRTRSIETIIKANDQTRGKRIKVRAILLHTVLSVATLNVPGIETPAPPPIVTPFKRATCIEIIYCTNMSIWTRVQLK